MKKIILKVLASVLMIGAGYFAGRYSITHGVDIWGYTNKSGVHFSHSIVGRDIVIRLSESYAIGFDIDLFFKRYKHSWTEWRGKCLGMSRTGICYRSTWFPYDLMVPYDQIISYECK